MDTLQTFKDRIENNVQVEGKTTKMIEKATSAIPSGTFLVLAWQLRRDGSRRRAALLFHYSLLYLALLFAAAALAPAAPLVLFVIPLDELILRGAELIFPL